MIFNMRKRRNTKTTQGGKGAQHEKCHPGQNGQMHADCRTNVRLRKYRESLRIEKVSLSSVRRNHCENYIQFADFITISHTL